jgi:hypothetical protein
MNENTRDAVGATRSSVPDLRVSDAERDAAVAELGEHFQAGRLDQEEYSERMAKALNSRTASELSALMKDLPPLPETANRPARPSRRPVYLPVLIPLLFAAFLIARVAGAGGPDHHGGPWVLFPLFWVIAIVALRFAWWRRSSAR